MQFHMTYARTMVDADITATHPVTAVEDDTGHKKTEIGEEAPAVELTVISNITVRKMKCVSIQGNISAHQRVDTIRTQYGVIRCQAVR